MNKAEIALLAIGGADRNAGDDMWNAGQCEAKACYAADLKAFGRNFDATVSRGARRSVAGR